MTRPLTVLVMVLVLAGCGSQSRWPGSDGGGGTTGAVSGTTGGDGGGYATVSGTIVRRDNGAPYPGAYVRFGWLADATTEQQAHTVTDRAGRYAIQLPAGVYQVSAGDTCDLNAGFTIAGRQQDDNMITVPGTTEVDFVQFAITPGADITGVC
jgi:hypothetical protein